MRGADSHSESLFTTVKLDDFVPANHPLRPIRAWVNGTLAKMDAKFSAMYEADIKGGRPSIAPEKLMREMDEADALLRLERLIDAGQRGHQSAESRSADALAQLGFGIFRGNGLAKGGACDGNRFRVQRVRRALDLEDADQRPGEQQ